MQLRITPAVKYLLIVTAVMFLVQKTADQFFGGNFMAWFGLVPDAVVNRFHLWQIFTYVFLHGDVMHLIFNLMMLAFIGGEIESAWNTARFLKFYFFCAAVAGIVYLLLQAFAVGTPSAIHQPMVGASAAMYGLLVAYGILYGERTLLFMMLFPLKAKHFIWILAGVEFLTGMYSTGGGLAAVAHLSGMGAGFVFLWGRAAWVVAKAKRGGNFGFGGGSSGKMRPKNSKLKLVVNNPSQKPGDRKDHSSHHDPNAWDKDKPTDPKLWN